MRILALVLLLTACKSSFSEEKAATLSSQLQKDATAQTSETRTVTQGPETITTTVEEYASPDALSLAPEPSSTSQLGIGLHAGGASTRVEAKSTVPAPPVLVKRTVIVDHRDPVVSQATLEAHAATETKAAAKSDSTDDLKKARAPAGLFGGLLSMWPWLLAAGIAAALYFRKDLVLGFLKTLAGRFIP